MSAKPFGIIYLVTNLVTGKHYVGQTRRTLQSRWKGHCDGKRCGRALGAAIRKYGRESFTIEPVFECGSAEELNRLETACISALLSHLPENGYNLNLGGNVRTPSEDSRRKMSEAQKGRTVSAEARRKLSAAKKGKKLGPFSPEHCRKIAEAGKGKHGHGKGIPKSEEHRRKIGEAHKGRSYSPEALLKMSEAKKGKPFPGKPRSGPLSPEHRRKIGEAQKGKKCRPFSDEHRRKIAAARTGKKLSLEIRQKISEASKGKPKSDQHRANISKGQTGRKHSEYSRRKMSEAKKKLRANRHAK